MIEIFLSLILFTILTQIAGLILAKSILKLNLDNLYAYEIGMIGIIFLVFLSFIFHFFVPLNQFYNSIIFILLISYFLLKREILIKNLLILDYKSITLSVLIVLVMTLKYNPNEDYGYYHLPYIVNLVSEKIIFGLSNLQPQFGWNSTWLNFSSLFYLPFLKIKGTQLSNSILFIYILYMFFNELFKLKHKKNISYFFILFLTCYVIVKFTRLSEHGFDFPANIYLIISIFYLIKMFEDENVLMNKKYFTLICCFSLFALTIKLSTFVSPFIVFIALLLMGKRNINFSLIRNSIIFCICFFLLWILQQFIFTGCFVPHFKNSCIQSVGWYTNDISKMISDLTGSVNKSFRHYNGNLSEENYIQNFNWVQTWFQRNKIEFWEHFAAIIIPFIILFLFNIKSSFKNNINIFLKIKYTKLFFISLLLLTFSGLLIWFLKSPVIRFGIPYLFCLIFIILILIIYISKISLDRGIVFIIALCVVFNLLKNINRVFKDEAKIYWPKILNVNYSSASKNGFIFNYPDSSEEYFKKKLCWSIPYPCSVTRGNNLKFEKKFTYTFITQDKN